MFGSLQIIDPRTPKTAPCLRWAELRRPPAALRADGRRRYRSAEKLFLVLFIGSKHNW